MSKKRKYYKRCVNRRAWRFAPTGAIQPVWEHVRFVSDPEIAKALDQVRAAYDYLTRKYGVTL